MTPDELFSQARDVICECNPAGVATENAEAFIEHVKTHLRYVTTWLPPVYGSVGYADSQVIDHLRQLKFQAEAVLRNFPMGIEALSSSLERFCEYLQGQYSIRIDDSPRANQRNWGVKHS